MREIPYEGITGGKTGFVNQSGFTLATTAERENLSLIAITLKSNFQTVAYKDTIKLLDYGFEYFTTSNISKGTTFMVGGQEYKTSKSITYTHSLGEQVTKEVNDDGTLEIKKENGTVISSFPLNKIEKGSIQVSTEEDMKQSSVFGRGHLFEFLFLLKITLISIGGFIYQCRQLVKK